MRKRGFGALALLVAVAACSGGGSHKPAARKASSAHKVAPKNVAVGKPAPLTDVPDPTGKSFTRPALTVKVENTPDGRPLWGVDEADVVYEEVVEGQITRLAAVFNSHAPDKIGPVRSVRRTDQSIVWPIGGIFAYSGGAPYAIRSINTAPVKQLDETSAHAAMFRDHSRKMPHNLYGIGPALFAGAADATPVPPPPLFTYRAASVAVVGAPVTTVIVGFKGVRPSYAVTWTWDKASATWTRSIFGGPDVTGTGVRLAAKNVVVMFVHYNGGAGVVGAEAELEGTGNAWVFTAGKVVKGQWSRPDKSRPAELLDVNGNVIPLAPGQTWVELPVTSYAVTTFP